MSGATSDGLFSSTMAEIMVIAVMLAILPMDTRAMIWCDSQAAIAMMRKMMNTKEDSWCKSPLAYVAQFFVPRIRQRTADLRLRWIPGHKGNEGNEAADKAAKDAQRQRQGWWTFRLGAPREQPFWVCAGNSIAPYKTGGIVKRQEEAWAATHLVRHVRLANSDADIREADLKELLEALNWSAANPNGTWTRKNSWCLTNTRDSNLRSFVLGAIFGVLPVAEREWAWYPQAYQEPEWKMCPCCNREIETQEHYFVCAASRQILGPGVATDEPVPQSAPSRRPNAAPAMVPRADRWTLVRLRASISTAELTNGEGDGEEIGGRRQEEESENGGPVAKWIKRVAAARATNVLIPRVWRLETADVIAQEMAQFGEKGRDWASRGLASDKELKSAVQWQRILRKIAIRTRWQKEYEERWLPRNAAQISKEEASAVKPKKRRALMRQPRPPDVVREDSTPTYPKELAAKKMDEYKKLCHVLIDDWRRGRKSTVPGKGLWSINPRFS
ncbi:hypothetical protein H4S07_001222 [Coemansia furcata]|uniref:Uncharacterized protein n=1 Tax=Coemansia furcata TaxID=417177 RepID=A0ACC1LPG6_9FUNG|nr:hypothetical protein H4S07_001222 [Coemansia furcata]